MSDLHVLKIPVTIAGVAGEAWVKLRGGATPTPDGHRAMQRMHARLPDGEIIFHLDEDAMLAFKREWAGAEGECIRAVQEQNAAAKQQARFTVVEGAGSGEWTAGDES